VNPIASKGKIYDIGYVSVPMRAEIENLGVGCEEGFSQEEGVGEAGTKADRRNQAGCGPGPNRTARGIVEKLICLRETKLPPLSSCQMAQN
jgi:hypothetical protein